MNLSLPYAEISYKGEVCVAKAEGSGGLLDNSTCAQQLLYEVGDPSSYITPDVVRIYDGPPPLSLLKLLAQILT